MDNYKKLMNFIFKKDLEVIIKPWYAIPRGEVEIFIKRKLNLDYIIKIRDCLRFFEYRYNWPEQGKVILEYLDCYNYCINNDLNLDYYGLIPLDKLINEIKK